MGVLDPIDRTLLGTAGRRPALGWAACVVVGGGLYGAVMGGFDMRPLQVAYSAVKVPVLIAATTVLALPSFFVLNTLLGLRADFRAAVRAVLGTQAAVAVVLASLSPYTALWYRTSGDYHEAVVFNGLMFAAASLAAQGVLRRRYAALEARDRRHRLMRRVWVVVYVFVGVQMGWVLRPFVGQPGVEPTFFRANTWGNAYVIVLDTVWQAVR